MTMRDAANQLPGPSLGMDVGLRRALDILCAGAAAAALAPLMLIVTLRSAASLLEVSWTSCRNSGTFCGVICRSWGHGPSACLHRLLPQRVREDSRAQARPFWAVSGHVST